VITARITAEKEKCNPLPAHALTGEARKIAKPSNFVKFRQAEDPSKGRIPLNHEGKVGIALTWPHAQERPFFEQKSAINVKFRYGFGSVLTVF